MFPSPTLQLFSSSCMLARLCVLFVLHLKTLFTYCQVNVAQEQLPAFLKTAEKLKIKGLAEGTQGAENE